MGGPGFRPAQCGERTDHRAEPQRFGWHLNARYLQNDNLLNHQDPDHVSASAAWHNGNRVPAADVVAQLGARVASERTTVHIVQPHLLRAVHDSARAAIDAGRPTRDSRSLVLLDTLLNSTRQTITAHVQDLWVGSA